MKKLILCKNQCLSRLRGFYDWLIFWADHKYNQVALSSLSFLEASIFPLPVDPLLLAMGLAAPKRSFYYAFLTTVFSVLGAIGGYMIGFYAWSFLSLFFFNYVFSENSFLKVVEYLQNTTFLSIFIAGFSPIPFKVFTLSAGVSSAPFFTFFWACVLSRGLRFFFSWGIGFLHGKKS